MIRGLALFGVLLVNLLYFFRIPLFAHILQFHSHPGHINHAIDFLVCEFVEFKAFGLFAFTFGIGIAIQAERARRRDVIVEFFLLKRFLILLVFGMAHMVLVSNVDILTLYAVCGLLMILLLRLPALVSGVSGLAFIYLPQLVSGTPLLAPASAWPAFVANANRVYSTGSFRSILEFRWLETKSLIFPLLINVAQETLGLMLIGAALWRIGILPNARRYRPYLLSFSLLAGTIGLLNTTATILPRSLGMPDLHFGFIHVFGDSVPMVFAYAAALFAWSPQGMSARLTAPMAAAGRMALTNYLMQSIVLALLFYGYGFGLFGKLDPQTATLIGVALYACQLAISLWWLRRYRFGPFEWIWRSLTYGHRQPMLREHSESKTAAHV
jgi:uncharacterized protein